MTTKPFNVLFLCSRNSARSIMAECILNNEGEGRFRAFSAGAEPADNIDPDVLHLLKRSNYNTEKLRPKTWTDDEIASIPNWDFVILVCDRIVEDDCPTWSGDPVIVHWDIPDPVKHEGSVAERSVFTAQVFQMLYRRVTTFAALRDEALEHISAQQTISDLGLVADRPTQAPQQPSA